MPGVTPATGDGAVTAQPDGIYVSITTSPLFYITLRDCAVGQQSSNTHTHTQSGVMSDLLYLGVYAGLRGSQGVLCVFWGVIIDVYEV